MAATVSVVQNCGEDYDGFANEVAKNISYFLPIDSCTANRSDNPIQVPDSGTIYSYEVYIRLRIDLAPANKINNIKVWYDSGMPNSGYKITVNEDQVASYSKPVNLQSSRGTRVDFTNKNSEGNSISLNNELVDVNDYSDYLVFQLEIEDTAEVGEFSVDYIIQYDES